MQQPAFIGRLATLLLVDVVLGLVYAVIPTSLTGGRNLIALAQLGFMAITLLLALLWVLEDY